jgi:hypothetical protein
LPDLELPVAAGAEGLENAVSWLHVSELADPTRWLEGGEFLLTTGLGLGEAAASQRAYVRRLARHGVAGLGFGTGFGFTDVPEAVVREADKPVPVLAVPYEVPFVAITKSAFTHSPTSSSSSRRGRWPSTSASPTRSSAGAASRRCSASSAATSTAASPSSTSTAASSASATPGVARASTKP